MAAENHFGFVFYEEVQGWRDLFNSEIVLHVAIFTKGNIKIASHQDPFARNIFISDIVHVSPHRYELMLKNIRPDGALFVYVDK